MSRYRWIFPAIDASESQGLAAQLGIGSLAAKALCARGLSEASAARRFLWPALEELHEPSGMRDMPQAVSRLQEAIRNSEKILVYGDYDVDGSASVVLLIKAIELAGGAVEYHIPHRLKDGYGMRLEAVEDAAAQGVKLIVSVDTGIRECEAVRRAGELGIAVIVTDHHLPEAALPPALAVLNPNRPECAYPDKNLCGAGVAFKLAHALLAQLGWPPGKLRRTLESFLKVVAIATVADVVPLSGENRIMVKHGLEGLRSVRNPGLRALLDASGCSAQSAPSARQVAFQIAPRINAAGRMDTARDVIELFRTADPAQARELAARLHHHNAERQKVEAGIRDACEGIPVDGTAAALVYYSEDWHRGVLGIVASRLAERFYRPVFVLGRNLEDGLAQGSGRSIPAFHLLEALESMRDLFVKFGGHEHAAGVTLEVARIDEFRQRLAAWAAARLRPQDLLPAWKIDAVADLREITEKSVQEVFALAPFGHGNPAPLFAALSVEIAGPPAVWKEKHLLVMARHNGRTLALKGWNLAGRGSELVPGARADLCFTLEEDEYAAARGYPGWCAVLRDFRPAGAIEVAGA